MKKSIFLCLLLVLALALCAVGCKPNIGGSSSMMGSSRPAASSRPSSQMTSSMPMNSAPVSSQPAAPTGGQTQVPRKLDPATVELPDLTRYDGEKKGWGQGLRVDAQNRPEGSIVYQEKYGSLGGIYIMPPTEKVMYLTFDEGYENGYTSQILDTLKEKDCQAVFFVTLPYVKSNPELVQRMIDEGHEVGNHSVNHKSMPTLTPEEQLNELAGLHNYMVDNFNYEMHLFRPPMGEFSEQSLVLAKAAGYDTILWSFAYLDYDTNNQMGVEKAFPRVSEAAHNGAVYLLHAVSADNTAMLGDLIDYWRGQGFTMTLLTAEEVAKGAAAMNTVE